MKIKVFFQDDIIAIRVAQDISFAALKDRLVERLKVNEEIAVSYKDETSGEVCEMRTEADLDRALGKGGKLVLVVGFAAG